MTISTDISREIDDDARVSAIPWRRDGDVLGWLHAGSRAGAVMSPYRLTIRQVAVLVACRTTPTHIDGQIQNGVLRGLILRDMLCKIGNAEYLATPKGRDALKRSYDDYSILAKWAEA